MKKIISVILAAAMILSMTLVVGAEDAKVYTEGYLKYTLSESGSITIVGNFGNQETLTVPAMIAGYPVNKIASGAFSGNTNLKTLNLPDTITENKDDLSKIETVNYTKPESAKAVAKIGTVEFSSLAAALAAAKSGETVTLVDNVDGEEFITVKAKVTLDLNGYNITNAMMIYSSGNIIDTSFTSTTTQLGYISAVGYSLSPKNQTYCPVYDSVNDGYSFVYLQVNPKSCMNGNVLEFGLTKNEIRAYAYSLFKANKDFTDYVKARIIISYTEDVNFVEKKYTYLDSITSSIVTNSKSWGATINGITGTANLQVEFDFYDQDGKIIYTLLGPTWETTGNGTWTK